jgi:serine/threonine-protein kinase
MGPRADRGAAVLSGVVLPARYEPIRKIAQGGMATVWCAQDLTLDRQVAIKILADPYAHDEFAGRRFKREARAAARLSGHPNVVTIYDVGEAPPESGSRPRPFLVMEYHAGGTVADALRTGTVNPVSALSWLQQAAAGLDYAHRRGVIHRDVKLANFLLDRERVLHVADFGIAQLGSEDTLTVSGEVLGTAAYLAPERALGQPATEASDRYALAVAAFELLVGERPFPAEHFAAQARQHVEDPPPAASLRNPALPKELDGVLARGMAKRPEERYPSSLAFTDAIEEALAPTAPTRRIVPGAVGRSRAPSSGSPHRPIAAGAVAGAGVAARAGAANSAARQRGPRSTDRPALLERKPHRPARAIVLAALSVVILGVAIAAAASGGSGGSHGAKNSALASRRAARRPRTATPAPKRSAPATTHHSTTPASPAPTTPATTPTPTAPASSGADALETQGHQLMEAGNYQSAIPVLRQAVASATPNSLTYAYALFDLGRSLRLAGDPRAAVPILYRRLQIPDQTSVVQSELTLALRALGQQVASSGGSAPGPRPGHHHPPATPGGQGD